MPRTKIGGIADSLIPVGISNLGTIVYDNVYFPFGTWTSIEGEIIQYNPVKLDAVSMTVNRSKIIVKSNVTGRVGSVKEYMTSGDYEISISAIIAPDTFSAAQLAQIAAAQAPGVGAAVSVVGLETPNEPIGLLYDLANLERVQDSVSIRSKILQNIYDINRVVIENMNIEKTGPETYTLKMQLLSDSEVDLKDFG